MVEAGASMQYLLELWNEWEIQAVVVASFSLQVILFFFAGIRRYSVSFVLKGLLWLVYLLADVVATYALGHMSSVLSKKSSDEHQLVAFWAPFLLLHLGGQDTITAYALEDNELWLRHLLNMFVQVACTTYVLYKYIIVGGVAFVPAAMWVLAAGVVKYGERIWALKRATKKGSPNTQRSSLLQKIYGIYRRFNPFVERTMFLEPATQTQYQRWINARDCFPKNKQFGTYAFVVMTAHALRHILVKPLIIDRNEESIDWNHPDIDLLKGHVRGNGEPPISIEANIGNREEPASVKVKMKTGQVYKAIEVELALMYDMLYTKAQVIHTWYGYCARVFSLVSCFTALWIFTNSKRDDYSRPDIVITFALLGGACTLEVASVLKVIGSTWTYDILQGYGWKWLPNAILFTRYHLVVVKDGRWSDSVGQFNFTSFCVHSSKKDLKGRIAKWIGLKDLWDKAHCTKHAKLSPALKEHVWGLLKGGDKSHMVQIEDVAIRSGYWARRFSGFEQSQQLDWTMSFEFQKSVLIWHIATDIFLSNSVVKPKLVGNKMGKAVNTLSDYMMYLLIEHPDTLPVKAGTQNLVQQARISYSNDLSNTNINDVLEYKKRRSRDMKTRYGDWTQEGWDDHPGEAVVVKAYTLAETVLAMELGLTHKLVIIGTVWKEMLCYAATNASGGFHARQLSNGGEFLTHILLLSEYCSAITGVAEFREIEDLNRLVSDSQRLTSLVLHLSQDIPDPKYTRQDSPIPIDVDEKYTYVPKRRKRKAAKPSKAADCAAGHIELTVDDSNDEITEIR